MQIGRLEGQLHLWNMRLTFVLSLGISLYELLDIEDSTDKKLIDAYYAAPDPGTQASVRKLLDIPEDQDEKSHYLQRLGKET